MVGLVLQCIRDVCFSPANFLVEKKVTHSYNLSEKAFLVGFLMETVDYAARRDFDAAKLACLMTVYISSHMYFKWYYWLAPQMLWDYFKEIMIRHTIEASKTLLSARARLNIRYCR